MMIKRTAMANSPQASVWVQTPWGDYSSHLMACEVFEGDYPTHSPLLGPDGAHLQYEPRDPIGFDLRSKK